jgi:Binding-protein-dependent transport system inner membrane component
MRPLDEVFVSIETVETGESLLFLGGCFYPYRHQRRLVPLLFSASDRLYLAMVSYPQVLCLQGACRSKSGDGRQGRKHLKKEHKAIITVKGLQGSASYTAPEGTLQVEAARSRGMTYVKSMRYVILPQALRRILPPLSGQFISLIKDSSLLGIIAIRELTKATREVVTTSLQPFELWFVCALLYLVLTFTLSMVLQYLERRQLAV